MAIELRKCQQTRTKYWDFVFHQKSDMGNVKSRISNQITICVAWHWLNVLLYWHQTWLSLFLVKFSFKDQSFVKDRFWKMISRKSDLLIKSKALKKMVNHIFWTEITIFPSISNVQTRAKIFHMMIHMIIHMIIKFQWSKQFKWFQGWAGAL